MHLTMEEMADLARGTVSADRISLMQNHLGSCTSCTEQLAFWQQVAQTARRQPSAEPSEATVRYVKSMLAAHYPDPRENRAPSRAQLIFDSLRTPALVGVRSAVAPSRQLLFGLDNHRIDLRMEPQLSSARVKMIGQILDSADPSNLLSNIPVFLHIGGRVVAATNTNEFGEFQLECDWLGNLLLSATLADGREVVAALGELTVSQDNDRSSADFSQADAGSVTEEERKKKKA